MLVNIVSNKDIRSFGPNNGLAQVSNRDVDINLPHNLYIHGFFDPNFGGNIGDYGRPEKPPRVEVDICKLWIKKFIDPRKTISTQHRSYGLKHFVEKWAEHYIPNGAFIQAAIELGFNYRMRGPNAWFNMSFIRAKKAHLIPSRYNEYQPLESGFGKQDPDLIELFKADSNESTFDHTKPKQKPEE
jgi:hypothetical protein